MSAMPVAGRAMREEGGFSAAMGHIYPVNGTVPLNTVDGTISERRYTMTDAATPDGYAVNTDGVWVQ